MSYYSDVTLRLTTKGAKELRAALDHDGKAILNGYDEHYVNEHGEFFMWKDYNHWPEDIEYALEELDPEDYRFIRIGESWENEDKGRAYTPGFEGWFEPSWKWEGDAPKKEPLVNKDGTLKKEVDFTVSATITREFNFTRDRDIWLQVRDYVTSEEFLETLKRGVLDGSISLELEL